jgi:hypothetical protein
MCFDPDRSLIASDGDGRDDERGKKWQAKIKSGKCQRRSINVRVNARKCFLSPFSFASLKLSK